METEMHIYVGRGDFKEELKVKSNKKNYLKRLSYSFACTVALNFLINIGVYSYQQGKINSTAMRLRSYQGVGSSMLQVISQKCFTDEKCLEDMVRIYNEVKNNSQITILDLEQQSKKSLERAFIYGYFKK